MIEEQIKRERGSCSIACQYPLSNRVLEIIKFKRKIIIDIKSFLMIGVSDPCIVYILITKSNN